MARRLPQARDLYRRALMLVPNHPDALHFLGVVALDSGDHDAAIDLIRRAIRVVPTASMYGNLGLAFRGASNFESAIESFQKALTLNPTSAETYSNLGTVFEAQRRFDKALECFQEAVALSPKNALMCFNVGNSLLKLGRLEEAETQFRKAMSLQGDLPMVHFNLGNVLFEQGKLESAAESYRRTIALQHDHADACLNLGAVYLGQNKLDTAIECFRTLISFQPNHAQAHNNLGNAYIQEGRIDLALESFRTALRHNPDDAMAHSNLLFVMQHDIEVSPADLFAEHLRYAAHFEGPLKQSWKPHGNSRDPNRRLKVGYVSGDFFRHAVAFFIEPIISSHDRRHFEIYCYYSGTRIDEITDRLRARADHWIGSRRLSDEELAEQIRRDGIDILVDLSGHTSRNRLLTFARKPAPIQVTWIGYAGTTGLSAVDYRISDEDADPKGITDRYHSEALIRLPTSGSYRPPDDSPPVNPLPALTGAAFTFGCLNGLAKINPRVISLWSRILAAVPGSRLMLGNVNSVAARDWLVGLFSFAGVDRDRIILNPRMKLKEYLALHHQIDLSLDTFPYNGGTTTCHSLWMGVPVITLAGQVSVSRSGATLLPRAGLREFVVDSQDSYVEQAIRVAADLPRLNEIRMGLRQMLDVHAEIDPVNFTRNLEVAYRVIWTKWCSQ